MYEIYLLKKSVDRGGWQRAFERLMRFLRPLGKCKLHVVFDKPRVQFFIEVAAIIPASLDGCEEFLFKPVDEVPQILVAGRISSFYFANPSCNMMDLYQRMMNKGRVPRVVSFVFTKVGGLRFWTKSLVVDDSGRARCIFPVEPSVFLAVDYERNRELAIKSKPKYLDIYKAIPIFSAAESQKSLLALEGFPYTQDELFLDIDSFDYKKHSVVFGTSGAGKSKFLSLLIERVLKNEERVKVVMIDPHDAMREDVGDLGKVIDFKTETGFLDLFEGKSGNSLVSEVELMIDVFRGLILDNYNSKLERVLRYSIFALKTAGEFNFKTLRRLMLDLEYRGDIIEEYKRSLPSSVVEFFLSEFNDLRTHSYMEAIAPIVAFIDELEMTPVFGNSVEVESSLKDVVTENALSLISLDRTYLGDRATRTIAGFVMCQLLNLIQNRAFDEHIIFIIDEVAVIENPVLLRFLSEARKFNCSLILAGQYFGAISLGLRTSIFANVVNFVSFRVSLDDAALLTAALDLKIPLDDSMEAKMKVLAGLQNRECVARLSSDDKLIPAFKAKTINFKRG